MEYSPSDIRHRSFSKGLRGFKTGEVQSFLNGLADAWEEKEERIENLESKLKKTRERTEDREEKLDMKEESLTQLEQSLSEREEEVEQKEKELRAITQRLQNTLENETDALTSLGDGDESASTEEFNLDDSTAQPASARTNGKSGASSRSSAGASKSNATSESKEKTSEEWVDSLFPNRLPGAEGDDADDAAESDEPKKKEKSASESQFEAIKEDVQGKSANSSSSSAEEEDEDTAPPTDEMERIWDVFDDPA